MTFPSLDGAGALDGERLAIQLPESDTFIFSGKSVIREIEVGICVTLTVIVAFDGRYMSFPITFKPLYLMVTLVTPTFKPLT